jgi:hypothetical protein
VLSSPGGFCDRQILTMWLNPADLRSTTGAIRGSALNARPTYFGPRPGSMSGIAMDITTPYPMYPPKAAITAKVRATYPERPRRDRT